MDKRIVGVNAGNVWHVLSEVKRISIPELARKLNLSVESTALAVGWLARENKVCIHRVNGLIEVYDEDQFGFPSDKCMYYYGKEPELINVPVHSLIFPSCKEVFCKICLFYLLRILCLKPYRALLDFSLSCPFFSFYNVLNKNTELILNPVFHIHVKYL